MGGMTGRGEALGLAVLLATAAPAPAFSGAPAVRAAYFYEYMGNDHLDLLRGAGFNRALVHAIGDSLPLDGGARLRSLKAHGDSIGVEVVPQWALEADSRLSALPGLRRYTWGDGNHEIDVACPLDSLFWRSALLDRAEEVLAAVPVKRMAVDLELHSATRTHYDAGPCRCRWCLTEYAGPSGLSYMGSGARRLKGLLSFEESRVFHILRGLLEEFHERHPDVEIGVFDLDLDSFVHRALARALARSGVPAADYCERSYSEGGSVLPGARGRLAGLGLPDAPLIGGVWLKRFAPHELPEALRSIASSADGYFVFTTYSLWIDPSQLEGPYILQGSPDDYWRALREVNATP
ncbi:MAG: hypothetical protein E6K73_02370 [Candidatus Eisenbacteria bacterium]|uniref:Glycoside hydrolase family 42 N-terminal domain-containing protein n=1 Tax=Eiseniibacteriota bacterium TaxID=2212470 RepID=A0A538SMU9_UNCEI|nr:MAG: hypothetical protein E6K73_02370 [Candidatus Eisenbacteria bacterium]